jgi:hypothetical protein
MGTVVTGASGASKGSFSGGGAKKKSSSSEDTKEQKKVLAKAAKEATPFCEECDKKKKKEKEEKEEKKKEETQEEEIKKEITRIFWVDEQGEQKTLDTIPTEYEITLCVDTKNIDEGEEIEIIITDKDGRNYKGGKQSLKFKTTVEADGCAYVEKVKLEYD